MTKHRSAEERIEQILEGARRCFVRSGYASTTMTEIAEESGLSKGGVYFHFDAKKEILYKLAESMVEQNLSYIDQVDEQEEHLLEKITEFGEHFLTTFVETESPRISVVLLEMCLHDEGIREKFHGYHRTYIETFAEILENVKQKSDGEIQMRDINPMMTSALLKAILDGLQCATVVGQQLPLDEFIESTVDILANGLVEEELEFSP